jgi:hypothetical protein
MSNLVLMDQLPYGKRYAISGMIPLVDIDLSSLEWGDAVTDRNGNGMTMYVHKCHNCGKRFLRGALALVSVKCPNC